jgi:DNA repair protein RadC
MPELRRDDVGRWATTSDFRSAIARALLDHVILGNGKHYSFVNSGTW